MDGAKYYDCVGVLGTNDKEQIRFQQTIEQLLPRGRLLDVGCGEGHWLEFIDGLVQLELHGQDISPVRLEAARERLSDKSITFNVSDLLDLPYQQKEFDQVTALEVLEHVPNWKRALSEILRVTAKRAIISVPYKETLKHTECGNCGERAYLYGHVNSFTEKDFNNLRDSYKVGFSLLPDPTTPLDHFIKWTGGAVRKFGGVVKTRELPYFSTVCPECCERINFGDYTKRIGLRIGRMLSGLPETLLVTIDKN